jgi:5-(carboxyamino)imidazole ribonucleotide mutase
MAKVGLVMGSASDWETMRHAAEVLDQFGVSYEKQVLSAHRTPEDMVAWAKAAAGKGLSAVIAGAGGAAHLPGMVASLTTLPVLGVPVQGNALQGLDSLLAIGNSGATNAALFAVRLLAVTDTALRTRLEAHRDDAAQKARASTSELK